MQKENSQGQQQASRPNFIQISEKKEEENTKKQQQIENLINISIYILGGVFFILFGIFILESIGLISLGAKLDNQVENPLLNIQNLKSLQNQYNEQSLQKLVRNLTPQEQNVNTTETLPDSTTDQLTIAKPEVEIINQETPVQEKIEEEELKVEKEDTNVNPLEVIIERTHMVNNSPQFTSYLQLSQHHHKRSRDISNLQVKSRPVKQNFVTKRVDLMERPKVDTNTYEYVELENSLRVLLVHDASAILSEIALSVGVGSWSDSKELPGLAHLAEHMVIQGSQKYPTKDFRNLIAANGGISSGYTTNTNTNFYFSVQERGLKESLDVFANFFIDPIFDQNSIQREINRIDAQYQKDISNDAQKVQNILKIMSEKSHPQSKFSTGNIDSLKLENMDKKLKEFVNQHYSANLMTLVIRTNQNIQELGQFIKQSDLNLIQNKGLKENNYQYMGEPLKHNLGSIVKFNVDTLGRTTIFTYQLKNSQSVNFVDYLIQQHQLKDIIIAERLGVKVHSGSLIQEPSFNIYALEIELSPVDHQHIDERQLALKSARLLSNYFQKLETQLFNSNNEPTNLLKQLYHEYQQLKKTQFQYNNGMSTSNYDINEMAISLSQNKLHNILSKDLDSELNDKELLNIIKTLQDPHQMVIFIGDHDYELTLNSLSHQEILNKKEINILEGFDNQDLIYIKSNDLTDENLLYNVEFSVKKLSKKTLQFISLADDNIQNNIKNIHKNEFIPKNLKLVSLCENKNKDDIILDVPTTFHLQSQYFDFNKISTNLLETNEESTMLSQIRSELEQRPTEAVHFTSMQECKKKELDYDTHQLYPQLINNKENSQLWWKLDRSYRVPAILSSLKISAPEQYKSAKEQALIKMISAHMNEEIQNELSNAFIAGYKFELQSTKEGLILKTYGWSDQFERFQKTLISTMTDSINHPKQQAFLKTKKHHKSNQERQFQRIKESLQIQLTDAFKTPLYVQASEIYLSLIMQQPSFNPLDLAHQLRDIQLKDMEDFKRKFLSNSHYDLMFLGNINRDEATRMDQYLKDALNYESQKPTQKSTSVHVPNLKGKAVVYAVQSQTLDETEGVLLNYYQIGRRSPQSLALMATLKGLLENQAYQYIGTKKDLMIAEFKSQACIDGVQIMIQGTHKPYEVNQQIEAFLKSFQDSFNQMSTEYFITLKTGAISLLKDQSKSLIDEGKSTWSYIQNGNLGFEERESAALLVPSIEIEDLKNFYDSIFGENSGKLSIQIYGQMMLQSMEIQSYDQFQRSIGSKGLKENQTFSNLKEHVAFDNGDLAKLVNSAYQCSYNLSEL